MVLPLLGAFSGDYVVQEDAISEQIFRVLKSALHDLAWAGDSVSSSIKVNQNVALVWTMTTENLKDKDEEGIKFYQFLQKSTSVDPMELVKFGLSDGLAAQQPGVVTMLRSVLDVLNYMMPIRQRYLYKFIHGERSGEMPKMEKRLRKAKELADEKIQEIRDENAFCPPRPKIFDDYPRPLKK